MLTGGHRGLSAYARACASCCSPARAASARRPWPRRPPRCSRGPAARRWSSPPTRRTRSATRWRPSSAASPSSSRPGSSPRTSTPARCSTSAWGTLQGHLRTVLAGAGVDELVADELTVLPGVEELLALGEVAAPRTRARGRSSSSTAGRPRRRCACSGCPRRWPATSSGCSRPTAARSAGMLAEPRRRRARAAAGAGWDRTVDALGELAEQLAGLRAMLADHDRTSIRLVLTPERVVAAETRRTLTALALHGLRVDGLIANRVLPGPPRRCGARRRAGCASGTPSSGPCSARSAGSALPLRTVPHTAAEPTGVPALLEVARRALRRRRPRRPPRAPAAAAAAGAPHRRGRQRAGLGVRAGPAAARGRGGPAGSRQGRRRARGHRGRHAPDGGAALGAAPLQVTSARLEDDDLCVVFRPDPAVWIREPARRASPMSGRRALRRATTASTPSCGRWPAPRSTGVDARPRTAPLRPRRRPAAEAQPCAVCPVCAVSRRCAGSGWSSRSGWPSRLSGLWPCCATRSTRAPGGRSRPPPASARGAGAARRCSGSRSHGSGPRR